MHFALSFVPARRKHLVHRTELGPCTSHSSSHIALVLKFRASSGCDLCLESTHNIWQQVDDRQPPAVRLPLVFPPPLQAPAMAAALREDGAAAHAAPAARAAPAAAAAVAAPAQTPDVTLPVVAAGGVKRKSVTDAASELEALLDGAADERKLVAAKQSGKDAKAKKQSGKDAKAKAKAKAKALAATAKGKGEGSPAIIVENSRNQIKAWTGRKGENMNKIVSFKHISQMKARKIAVNWLVSRCKELKIVVPAKVK